jgi:hypothetical protein
MADHVSTRTTQFYDRRVDEVTLDEEAGRDLMRPEEQFDVSGKILNQLNRKHAGLRQPGFSNRAALWLAQSA